MEEKYYEILRHYVNPNDCAIVVKQLLSLHNVSQQREMLIDFMNKTQGKLIWGWDIVGGEKLADEYLKGNL